MLQPFDLDCGYLNVVAEEVGDGVLVELEQRFLCVGDRCHQAAAAALWQDPQVLVLLQKQLGSNEFF